MKIIAVDPGLSGVAVALERTSGGIVLLSVIDLPIAGEGARRRFQLLSQRLNDPASNATSIQAEPSSQVDWLPTTTNTISAQATMPREAGTSEGGAR